MGEGRIPTLFARFYFHVLGFVMLGCCGRSLCFDVDVDWYLFPHGSACPMGRVVRSASPDVVLLSALRIWKLRGAAAAIRGNMYGVRARSGSYVT